MSEELSRVKSRAKSVNKSAATKTPGSRRPSGGVPEEEAPAALSRSRRAKAGAPARSAKTKQPPSKPKEVAAKGRPSGSRTAGSTGAGTRSRRQSAAGSGRAGAEGRTPSRTAKHSSERVRLSKIFVNSLNALFLMLLALLLLWGIKGAPPLDELW